MRSNYTNKSAHYKFWCFRKCFELKKKWTQHKRKTNTNSSECRKNGKQLCGCFIINDFKLTLMLIEFAWCFPTRWNDNSHSIFPIMRVHIHFDWHLSVWWWNELWRRSRRYAICMYTLKMQCATAKWLKHYWNNLPFSFRDILLTMTRTLLRTCNKNIFAVQTIYFTRMQMQC